MKEQICVIAVVTSAAALGATIVSGALLDFDLAFVAFPTAAAALVSACGSTLIAKALKREGAGKSVIPSIFTLIAIHALFGACITSWHVREGSAKYSDIPEFTFIYFLYALPVNLPLALMAGWFLRRWLLSSFPAVAADSTAA